MRAWLMLTVVVASVFSVAGLRGEDWPTWRHDASRSGASAEELPAQLQLRWTRELPPPRPAFPGEVRLRYDASYEPVVAGGIMFVPSMVTDSVTALDADSGAERWRFFADGPVRFAPVAAGGRVYFTSDDGYLYCVDAEKGSLEWKFRGLPADRADRKLLGGGRLISLYPARGGPVVADGVVYFAAGIWPTSGVFVHALDAGNGEVVWSNTESHHLAKGNLDHGVESPAAGLTPQGYLAILGDRLVVPCGAQLPAFLDRTTGELDERYTMGWGGRIGLPKGTWFVAGSGDYLANSGDLYDMSRPNDETFRDPRGRPDFKGLLYPGSFTRLLIDPANQKALGQFSMPVFGPGVMFANTRTGQVAAYDLSGVDRQPRTAANSPAHRKDDHYPDKWQTALATLWQIDSPWTVHIQAGSRLYAAGPGQVAAIDVPKASGEASVSWKTGISGTPHRMLAADGKPFVVTLEGQIHAFAAPSGTPTILHLADAEEFPTGGAADGILKETGVTDGYALVLGLGDRRLAESLLQQSELYVIAVDPDAEKVAALRARCHAAGVYGTRISVCQGDPLTFPFPPYLASLIVSGDAASVAAASTGRRAEKIFHPLRPYGGVACLTIPRDEQESLAGEFSKGAFDGLELRQTDDMLLATRSGPLPGAADWSHDRADAANRGATDDHFLRPPLSMLWFDGSMRWYRKPGSNVLRVAGGRLFVRTAALRAIDVYTGRPLWEVPLTSPGGSPPGDMAVASDAIYAAVGPVCRVLSPATGETIREIPAPEGLDLPAAAAWKTLRVVDDQLLATIGPHVVCLERGSGQVRWIHDAPNARLSLAVGGGRVFCSELPPPLDRRGEGAAAPRQTVALDLKTGEPVWQISGGSAVFFSEAHDRLVMASGVYRGEDGQRVGESHRAWCVAGDQLISSEKPEIIELRDVLSGDRSGDPLQWFRRGCTSLRASRNLVTTRLGGNAAYIDLETREITPVWTVRSGCHNNLYPACGVLNMPNLTGGCTCNYTPTSMAMVPEWAIECSAGEGKK